MAEAGFLAENRGLFNKDIDIEELKRELGMLSKKENKFIAENRLLFMDERNEKRMFLGMPLYGPYKKQRGFMLSNAIVRLFYGGNQIGKSLLARWEALIRAGMDIHPISGGKIKQPSRGRIVMPSFKMIDEELPDIKAWLPKVWLIGGEDIDIDYEKCWERSYNKEFKRLSLANGSVVDFMSYTQEITDFEKVKLDWVFLDEEAPYSIYKACVSRLFSTNGCLWIAVTVLYHSGWMLDEIVEKSEYNKDIECFNLEIWDNPYLTVEGVKRRLALFDEEELISREKGQFLVIMGLIYGLFNTRVHCIPREEVEIKEDWTHYMACDPHDSQPFYFVWLAVSPKGHPYVYRIQEAKRESTIGELATLIKTIEGELYSKDRIYRRYLDPVTGNKGAKTGGNQTIKQEFAKHGIYFQDGQKAKEVRTMKLRELLNYDTDLPVSETNKPKLRIVDDCYGLIHDLKRANYKEAGDPHLWHYLDCLEWLACGDCRYVSKIEQQDMRDVQRRETICI